MATTIETNTNSESETSLLPLANTDPVVLARRRQRLFFITFILIVDALALGLTFAMAYFIRFKLLDFLYQPPDGSPLRFYSQLVFWLTPPWLVILAFYRLYDLRELHGGTNEYRRAGQASTMAIIMILALSFLLDEKLLISRAWLLLVWLLSVILVCSGRFISRRVLYRLRRHGLAMTRVLLIGANSEARRVAEQLSEGRNLPGLDIIGFIGDRRSRDRDRNRDQDRNPSQNGAAPSLARTQTHEANVAQRRNEEVKWPGRWLGQLENVRQVVEEYKIDEVVLSSTALSAQQLFEVIRNLTTSQVEIRLSPNLYDILTTGLAVQEINGLPLVTVSKVRITGLNAVLKFSLDMLVSGLVLLIFSPIFLLCALLIRLDSPGSPIHRRQVVGQGGKVFDAYKLRTMRIDGDAILAAHPDLLEELKTTGKLKNDPRITRLGHFLRKTSLDELPQLVNVLRGQMSLVGPRMITYQEMVKFGRWQSNLMTVKPGLTGLWQVSGRSNLSYEDRVRLDMSYIRSYSLWGDIRILFLTIPAVLKSRGAY